MDFVGPFTWKCQFWSDFEWISFLAESQTWLYFDRPFCLMSTLLLWCVCVCICLYGVCVCVSWVVGCTTGSVHLTLEGPKERLKRANPSAKFWKLVFIWVCRQPWNSTQMSKSGWPKKRAHGRSAHMGVPDVGGRAGVDKVHEVQGGGGVAGQLEVDEQQLLQLLPVVVPGKKSWFSFSKFASPVVGLFSLAELCARWAVVLRFCGIFRLSFRPKLIFDWLIFLLPGQQQDPICNPPSGQSQHNL